MKVCVAGAYGAFGRKHIEAIGTIEGVEITSVMGPDPARIKALADEIGAGHWSSDLADCIARDDVDAVILATPTQLHKEQALACMDGG